ncbi:uncharacterized protein DFL_008075 [Arthrobotrys flagrans]|uniref:Uncharacterized protein n=1 Tax=Arthrobotrys flagrans TaxID=97331 RepID=A0A436ZMQ6_ARTFL|nr:hypothetical protein DFL_008075 [Arthrobotrys flagrans]
MRLLVSAGSSSKNKSKAVKKIFQHINVSTFQNPSQSQTPQSQSQSGTASKDTGTPAKPRTSNSDSEIAESY